MTAELGRTLSTDALARITAGNSGAKKIGVSSIPDITAADVQAALEGIKTYADTVSAEIDFTVADEGNPLTQRSTINFTGPNVSAVDNAGAARTDIAISAPADASETVKGVAEIATQTETNTGTDDVRIITPLKLAGRTATETRVGVAEIATQAETDAGTDDSRMVTPLKLKAWLPTRGGFRATSNATQSVTNVTDTSVNFQTVVEGNADGWYSTSTSRYTPLRAGFYQFTAGIKFLAMTDNAEWRFYLAKNGVNQVSMANLRQGGAGDTSLVGTALVRANGTTDYFQVVAWQSSAASRTITNDALFTHFGAVWVAG